MKKIQYCLYLHFKKKTSSLDIVLSLDDRNTHQQCYLKLAFRTIIADLPAYNTYSLAMFYFKCLRKLRKCNNCHF